MLLAALAVILLLQAGSSPQVEHRARSAGDPFNHGNPAFCEPKEPVEDFGLSELPPVNEAPEDGDLPFGPKTVSLDLSAGPVLAPGEGVGFWLHSRNHYGRTPLNWALRNRIRLVDASGQAGQVVARGRTRVPTIRSASEVKLFLTPPRNLGFYLYEIEIVDFDGKLLAKYGWHVRVERKFWDAKFGLNHREFQPGDQVWGRIENFGTEQIVYGEEFRIQAYTDGHWVSVRNPSAEGWLFWLGFVMPGRTGECNALSLPDDFPRGQYRLVKEVERYVRRNKTRTYLLTAPFEVVD